MIVNSNKSCTQSHCKPPWIWIPTTIHFAYAVMKTIPYKFNCKCNNNHQFDSFLSHCIQYFNCIKMFKLVRSIYTVDNIFWHFNIAHLVISVRFLMLVGDCCCCSITRNCSSCSDCPPCSNRPPGSHCSPCSHYSSCSYCSPRSISRKSLIKPYCPSCSTS